MLPTFAADSCPDGVASICPSEAVPKASLDRCCGLAAVVKPENKSDEIGAVVRIRDMEARRWLLWMSWW